MASDEQVDQVLEVFDAAFIKKGVSKKQAMHEALAALDAVAAMPEPDLEAVARGLVDQAMRAMTAVAVLDARFAILSALQAERRRRGCGGS